MIRSVKPGTKTNVTQVAFYEERNIIFNLIFFSEYAQECSTTYEKECSTKYETQVEFFSRIQ